MMRWHGQGGFFGARLCVSESRDFPTKARRRAQGHPAGELEPRGD
jgi:hypothetical protein